MMFVMIITIIIQLETHAMSLRVRNHKCSYIVVMQIFFEANVKNVNCCYCNTCIAQPWLVSCHVVSFKLLL